MLKRLVDPDGVVLSGTCERPPPSDRLPQVRFFSGTVPARSRKVLPHEPDPAVAVKSNNVAGSNTAPLVVEVVDEVVEVEVVGMTDELVLDVVVVGRGPVDDEVDDEVDEVLASMVDDELVVGISPVELVELVVVTVDVLEVVAPTQRHSDEQVSPGWQLKAPVGELESHSSPGSTMPLPHRMLVVEVELDVVGVDVLDDVLDEELVVVTATHMHCEQTSPG